MRENTSISMPRKIFGWYILFFLLRKKYERMRPCITPSNIRKENRLIFG
jgi:hypothetical protein